jgi:hypothetical protein
MDRIIENIFYPAYLAYPVIFYFDRTRFLRQVNKASSVKEYTISGYIVD